MNDFDPIGRELCPDGSCIGIIGPDRTCRECGRPSQRPLDPRVRGLVQGEFDEPPVDSGGLDRELCPDGACVGVVGANGRCGTCGLGRRSMDGDAGAASEPAGDDTGDTALANPEFDDRELCPDGACIGLLGADGRCLECGTSRSN